VKSIFARSLIISGVIVALSGNYAFAQSQIVPDSTLGAESSTVTPAASDSTVDEIQGGAIRGTNLFHSFRDFNVSEGRSAYFLSPNANIQNILARVTGANPSEILGTLGTRGVSSPNLFLINPNGIIFGQNASLNVGGSFVASTASSLKFADGTDFSATEPQTTSLLTVSVPIGLQFGGNVSRIVNRSIAVDSSGLPLGLQLKLGKTLALVGGDVALERGNLTAESGRIELGSIAGSSLVSLTPNAQGFALGYESVENFRDIQLSQAAVVDATGEGGGDVQVQGRRVTLTNGSTIRASTQGALSGGTLSVNASDSVELSGFVATDRGLVGSSLRTDTQTDGAAGDLRINTRKLIVQDRAFVSNITFGTGKGGNLDVAASEFVELIGSGSGLFTRTEGAGAAGNLTITTSKLIVGDGAQVTASTFVQGQGGEIRVNAADSVDIFGVGSNRFSSGLFTRTTGGGNGGNITVDTNAFRIADGAVVDARTTDAGNGGNIRVNTNTFEAVNGGQVLASGFKGSSGLAGNVTVNANDSIKISGNVPNSVQRLIRVGSNTVVENDDPPNSGLFVLSRGSGNAGNLELTANSVRLENQGKLTATSASGKGGNIRLSNKDLLLLRGNSEISTNAGGAGNGGNINIDTDLLAAVENSNITANAVQGRGGNIKITTQGLFLSPDSQITASSERGINGIVEINRPDIDPTAELVTLPAQIVDVSGLVAQGCGAGGGSIAAGTSEFVDAGRGGLPPTPAEATRSDTTLADLGRSDRIEGNRASVDIPSNLIAAESAPLVEASGWVTNSNGEVILTANAPSFTTDVPWLTPTSCKGS
jgi:filamentous hemagglutinin family protein